MPKDGTVHELTSNVCEDISEVSYKPLLVATPVLYKGSITHDKAEAAYFKTGLLCQWYRGQREIEIKCHAYKILFWNFSFIFKIMQPEV